MQAYPFDIDWKGVFVDPFKPLAVDIGSGMVFFFIFSLASYCLISENYCESNIHVLGTS